MALSSGRGADEAAIGLAPVSAAGECNVTSNETNFVTLLPIPVLSFILTMYKCRCSYSCLVILRFSISNIQNITYVKFISLLHKRTMLVVAKLITWTLDSNQPHISVDIMIHSFVSKSQEGLLQCHKNNFLIPLVSRRKAIIDRNRTKKPSTTSRSVNQQTMSCAIGYVTQTSTFLHNVISPWP